MELTAMQEKIYRFLQQSIAQQGYAPSVREIGLAVGLKSPSTVHFHLTHLEEAGLIMKSQGKGRALTLVQQTQQVPENQIPVLGHVAAGNPILAQECIEEYLAFDTGGRNDEFFALRVRGFSMKDAGILPDDLVVVRRQVAANHGEIVVAMFEDEATVKRLSLKNGQRWLLPENEEFSPIDGRDAAIIGKVAAVVRKY